MDYWQEFQQKWLGYVPLFLLTLGCGIDSGRLMAVAFLCHLSIPASGPLHCNRWRWWYSEAFPGNLEASALFFVSCLLYSKTVLSRLRTLPGVNLSG